MKHELDIQRLATYSEWEESCFVRLKSLLSEGSGRLNIALSGGTTPIGIYRRLGHYLASISEELSSRLRFFVVDERDVPLTSEQSNSRMIMECLGDRLFIPFDPTTTTPEHYYEKIETSLGENQGFDVIILGCGVDGHTASLFPSSPLLNAEECGFLANTLPTGETRYSLTFPVLLGSRKRIVLVNDNLAKLEYFSKSMLAIGEAPIHQVLQNSNCDIFIHERLQSRSF